MAKIAILGKCVEPSNVVTTGYQLLANHSYALNPEVAWRVETHSSGAQATKLNATFLSVLSPDTFEVTT
jgi:hypothetical protein